MRSIRTALLGLAGVLMSFAAYVTATTVVPHLHEDLVEISVRPTLVNAIVVALRFGTLAMAGFAVIVIGAAVQSVLNKPIARLPLVVVAAVFVVFGIAAFTWTGSHHPLGYVLIGILILAGTLSPGSKD